VILVVELVSVLLYHAVSPSITASIAAPAALDSGISNTEALGRILYTRYLYFFEAAGIILLIAMIGAIVLTLRHKEGVKRQDVGVQVARRPATAVELVKIGPGEARIPASRGGRQ
jgi:NADH-quinone oxidoreductase subunit J